ncbi:hypothetical protein QAD02_012180 [Eretmocerus hayati]|uniref:Uncharacterized protein n=1 Tax=Eretmocerus hayati TaxID=131215 RepID=A0ACC2NZW8_9HYME|nr:hypothetical protein QAD02_012180 [Eretmocerus hayati]
MNPQYLQQQHQNFGPPSSNPSHGEPNANFAQSGITNSPTTFPPKGPLGPPPMSNAGPPKSPYYMNDAQNHKTNVQNGSHSPHLHKDQLADQMSSMDLSGYQRPPPPQNFSSQTNKVPPPMHLTSAVNGVTNQNRHLAQGDTKANQLYDPRHPQQKPFQNHISTSLMSSPTSLSSPNDSTSEIPFLNTQQHPGPVSNHNQPPGISKHGTISPSLSPSLLTSSLDSHLTQNKPDIATTRQANMGSINAELPNNVFPTPPPSMSGGSSTSNQPPRVSPKQLPLGQTSFNNQSSVSTPALSRPLTTPALSSPPLPGQNLQNPSPIHEQSLAKPPLSNQFSIPSTPASFPSQSLNQSITSRPPLPGQSAFSAASGQKVQSPPPLSQQNLSKPPVANQFGSPLMTGQNLPNHLPAMNQQSTSRPPPSNQFGGSSWPRQPTPPNSMAQQSLSGPVPPMGQPTLHPQYPHSNSIQSEQRRFSPSPSFPGQTNTANSHGHVNQPYSDMSPAQGYPYYGQTVHNNMYANQMNQYQTRTTSPTEGYQSSSQSQARRLDPDQMPSPIQVIQDDQRMKGGVFTTNQKGLVPPLVTTKFTVEDQGNASPRFIRSSVYTVPTTADIVKQTQVPFALILSPMAQLEENECEPPVIDMGEIGPVRCNRCKAYMSPFMQFVDAGRRFQCMFCRATTEVPSEYFQHLDHTGQRMDRYERPELILGTYEFLATKDYCRDNKFPKPPAIIFVIDVSYNNIKSGLVNLLCCQMKKIIRNLPIDVGQNKSNMKIGFITYNSSVHFYNLKSSLAQPQMMIIGDVQEMFMPLLDGFLVDPEESEALIDSLMSQIPTMFGETRETETILAPAIQAGLEAMKASECSGKLMVFHSSLPSGEAPGKLKNRDDRKVLGTDKEKSVLSPQNNFYNNLGQDCVGSGCSVDLFVFNNSYVDIATIGQVCRLTGGELYKYTYFQASTDGDRLVTDIMNNIGRLVAFDAVMRVRTSTGVRPVDFHGHFYMSNTTDIELASIDCDKAVAVEIKHDDKLSEDEGVYIQAALLYTSCSGVRRLRIINLSLKTSSQMSELYKACDLDAMINFLFKQSVSKIVDSSPKAVKENLNSRCAAILASYRKHCASPSSAGQLILPECMKLLPLYINGISKSDAITGGAGVTLDQKAYVMMAVATMPISETLGHVYPRLLPLHNVNPQDTDLPPMLRCSVDKFADDGAYLLENGIHMFLWLGSSLNPQWVQAVFGVASVIQVDTDRTIIPALDNPLNKRIRDIISYVQSERRYCMRLTLTKQRDKMEMVLRQFLVEDRGVDGSPSYVDFLCHMHREIRTLLS